MLLAGCGVGQTGHQAPATLTVTRDFGARVVREVQVKDGATVGALVRGEPRGARFVNGVAADDDTKVHGGDRVWADAAAAIARTPAVVGSFPEPFLHGIDGKRLPVRIECADARGAACRQVADRLAVLRHPGRARRAADRARAGDPARARRPVERAAPRSGRQRARARAARQRRLRADRARRAHASPCSTRAGAPTRTLGAGSGLVAAMKRPDDRPTWVVTGTDAAGVASAARAFEEGTLGHRFALAVSRDLPVALPAPG